MKVLLYPDMKVLILCLCFASIILHSCNQTTTRDSLVAGDIRDTISGVQIRNQSLENVLADYLEVKDALVLSNLSLVQAAGSELSNSLEEVKGCESTAAIAQKLVGVNSIDEQRELFTSLTAEILPVFKETEITSGSIFVQFCPMANDSDGGYWLAKEEQVKNPYFGDKMLKCGKVVEEISQTVN